MKGIIDRFEDGYAVIEVDGIMRDVRRSEVDPKASVNDVVILADGIWKPDHRETEKRTKEIKNLMDQLWED